YGHTSPRTLAWSNQLEKVDSTLKRWDKTNSTMDGQKKIIQMIVGEMTQYLTQVQGMPKDIEKLLTK
ncbi:hypothetical protein L218DRAFT_880615, partial [Marasmius fiardii PR-910]